ncbi:hypothetical protein ACHAWF_007703 [Thalassiosira exigua]
MPDVDPNGNRKLGIGNKFSRFKEHSSLMNNQPNKVSEDSWLMARNLVHRSPCCAVCKASDFNFNAGSPTTRIETKWKCCPRCMYGWCCCEEHFEEYMADHTKTICDNYIQATKMDLFRRNHVKKEGDYFMLMPEQPLSSPMKSFPRDWEEYLRRRLPMEYGMRMHLPDEFFPCSTFLLSQVNTILFGMYTHDRDYFISLEELTIHVLGPSTSFEYQGGSPTCIWEEIMHCLPAVKKLNVVFVGPEGKIEFGSREIACCPDCNAKGRIRCQAFHSMSYHAYYSSVQFIKPDFVAAYNTGMFKSIQRAGKRP